MMRNFFWGLAALPLLALLATSCGKETIESKADLEKILAFKANTGKQTFGRAAELSIGDLQDEQLTVYSYKDDGSPYRTFTLNHGGGEWTYTPVVFHPTTFGLKHYSVYPTTTLTNTSGEVKFNYAVGQDLDDTDGIDDAAFQEDLMVASAHTTHLSVGEATANLVYKHVLSQVNFAIQGKKNLIVKITDIKVVGVKNTGTFTFNAIGAIGDAGVWSNLGGSATYDYISVNGNATDGSTDNEIFYLGNTGKITGGDNENDNALMLMPQTFSAAGAGFTFNYELRNLADDGVIELGSATVDFADLIVAGGWDGKWLQGKRYLYIIIFDPILLQFHVEPVIGWIDGNNIDVERENMDII